MLCPLSLGSKFFHAEAGSLGSGRGVGLIAFAPLARVEHDPGTLRSLPVWGTQDRPGVVGGKPRPCPALEEHPVPCQKPTGKPVIPLQGPARAFQAGGCVGGGLASPCG